MAAYTAAKARLLDFQRAEDSAVLGRDDPGAWDLREKVKGRLNSFGFSRPQTGSDGTYYEDGMLYLSERGVQIPLLRREQISLRGDHNLLNALAAFAIGQAAGLPLDAMLVAAEAFQGVAHRLQLVRMLHGAAWYDDSIATTPERVMAAIRAFDEPIVLLLGGRDKKLPWGDLARLGLPARGPRGALRRERRQDRAGAARGAIWRRRFSLGDTASQHRHREPDAAGRGQSRRTGAARRCGAARAGRHELR